MLFRSHRERYSRISWVDYSLMGHDTLTFLPPPEVLEKYSTDYADMQENFIHDEAPPSFAKLHQQLKRLQGMVRLKKDGKTLEEILSLAIEQAKNTADQTISVLVVIPPDVNGGREARYQVDLSRQGETWQFEQVTILQ